MNDQSKSDLTVAGVALRFGIVALTLGTAYIHSTLGGLLFTLNATGYAVAAVAMIVPIALAIRFRWFIRLGLIGYALASIVGWAIMGPCYSTAYIAKAHRGRADLPPRRGLPPRRWQPGHGRQAASSRSGWPRSATAAAGARPA